MGRPVRNTLIGIIMGLILLAQIVSGRSGSVLAKEEQKSYKPIEGYLVETAKPDGRNGYYCAFPGVRIYHRDKDLVTRYRFISPMGEETGCLTAEAAEKIWGKENQDGVYTLEICLEEKEPDMGQLDEGEDETDGEETDGEETDEEEADGESMDEEESDAKEMDGEQSGGEETDIERPDDNEEEEREEYDKIELEKWTKKWEWKVDSTPPLIYRAVPEKDGIWYQDGVLVKAYALDEGSGVERVQGGCGKHAVDGTDEVSFSILDASVKGNSIKAWVKAEDRAGNQSWVEWSFLIDKKAPVIQIEGAADYAIENHSLNLVVSMREENILHTTELDIKKSLINGDVMEEHPEEWKENGNGEVIQQITVKEDGIYIIRARAMDASGKETVLEKQVIIDKTLPELIEPEKFEGKYLKEFCWDYDKEEFFRDFTSCTAEIRLDGRIYSSGKKIRTEGKHVLQVKVCDAAGNMTEDIDYFVVDRTAPDILCINEADGNWIKDGGLFEGGITLRAYVSGSGEWIREIIVNGVKKSAKISRNEMVYKLNEPGAYEICITAWDQAGNQSVKWIGVRIEEPESERKNEESILHAMENKLLQKNKKESQIRSEDGIRTQEETETKTGNELAVIIMIVMIVGIFLASKTRK